jgi:hypothetical protein
MIISRKALARAKLEKLKDGYSVYTETEEVANYIEKELANLGKKVHIDRTPIGCWFIPEERLNDNNKS